MSPACKASSPHLSVIAEENKRKGLYPVSPSLPARAHNDAQLETARSKLPSPFLAHSSMTPSVHSAPTAHSASTAYSASSMTDTGCFPTMFNTKEPFETLTPVPGIIETANKDSAITNIQKGVASLKVHTKKNKVYDIKMEALYSEKLGHNLISVSQLTELGLVFIFKRTNAKIVKVCLKEQAFKQEGFTKEKRCGD